MEGPSLKRPRVTEDILSQSSKLSNYDLKDTTKDKVNKISAQIEKLEAENYALSKQIEWSNHTHELSTKENARKIAALIEERNDIKARTIHHKARADEASTTLQVMKAKHIEVTNELREKVANNERQLLLSQQAFEEQQIQTKKQEKQVQHLKESHEIELDHLKRTIEILTQANQDQLKTIETVSERERKYVEQISQFELDNSNEKKIEKDQELYDTLADQYRRVCKHAEKLESENSKLSSELKHYKGISQNVELLREERNSLKQQLNSLDEIKNDKFLIEVENANLIAERESWARYLDAKPEYNQQSPASIIGSLKRDAIESKYLKREVQQLQDDLQNQFKLIGSLEDHIDDLKKVALENERTKSLSTADHLLFDKREDILKKHITILQDQLRLYDEEEKHNMESSYDQNKTLRIAQLEMFLREAENSFKAQSQEVIKSIQSNTITDPITISAGPYEQLTSGMKIVDFLQQINKEKERFIQELVLASKQSLEQQQQQQQQQQNHTLDSTTIPQEQQHEHRILQLNDNPASVTKAIRKELLTRLEKENQDLLKLQIGDVTVDTVTMPSSSYTNMQKQILSLEKRIARFLTIGKNSIKDTIGRIRELWGYHAIFRLDGCVRLESVFVDKAELAFLVKDEDDESILRIVGSNKEKYMDLLGDIYQTYIISQRSVPAFLNAAYLELYMISKHDEEGEEEESYMTYDDAMDEEPSQSTLYEEDSVEMDSDSNPTLVYQSENEEIVLNDEEEEMEQEDEAKEEDELEEEEGECVEVEYDEESDEEECYDFVAEGEDEEQWVDEEESEEDLKLHTYAEDAYDYAEEDDDEEDENEDERTFQQNDPSAILLVDSDDE
ncbi:unnamed protein product [Mucor hiemalis]